MKSNKRAKPFILKMSNDNFNWVSSWNDELYCTALKDGTYSLRARKNCYSDGSWWFKSRKGIRTPKQFVDAFQSISEIDTTDWSIQEDILPNLFKNAPLFAVLTHKWVEINDNEAKEEIDFFLDVQGYLFASKINLPEQFLTSIKVLEEILIYIKISFLTEGVIPSDKHQIADITVIFPKKTDRISSCSIFNKELDEFRANSATTIVNKKTKEKKSTIDTINQQYLHFNSLHKILE